MNIRTLLSLGSVLVATAMSAIGSAQGYNRRIRNNTVIGGYGRGPFYPSWIPGASSRYVGAGVPLRSGGAQIYFGPGGGYYGNYPSYYGYGYGYSPYSYYGPTTYYYSTPGYYSSPSYGHRYRPHSRRHR